MLNIIEARKKLNIILLLAYIKNLQETSNKGSEITCDSEKICANQWNDDYGNVINKKLIDNSNNNIIKESIYGYDAYGSLRSYSDEKYNINYKYDTGGQRITKKVNSSLSIYVNGFYTIADGQVNKHISDGKFVIASIPDNDQENIIYYHSNHLGSTASLSDASGHEKASYTYLPYGKMWVASELQGGVERYYTNHVFDQETELYYSNARYYDPDTTLFMRPDPAMDGLNHYAYAGCNPVMYSDPTGLWVDNNNGTYTAEKGDTLYGLYGEDWRNKSGYNGDPTKMPIGTTVGNKNIEGAASYIQTNNNGSSQSGPMPRQMTQPMLSQSSYSGSNIDYNSDASAGSNESNAILDNIYLFNISFSQWHKYLFDPAPSEMEINGVLVPVMTGYPPIVGLKTPRIAGLSKYFKIGGGGRLQAYNPANGRYIKISETVKNINKIVDSKQGQFYIGFGEGFIKGYSGSEIPVSRPGAHAIGQLIGEIIGNIAGFFFN